VRIAHVVEKLQYGCKLMYSRSFGGLNRPLPPHFHAPRPVAHSLPITPTAQTCSPLDHCLPTPTAKTPSLLPQRPQQQLDTPTADSLTTLTACAHLLPASHTAHSLPTASPLPQCALSFHTTALTPSPLPQWALAFHSHGADSSSPLPLIHSAHSHSAHSLLTPTARTCSPLPMSQRPLPPHSHTQRTYIHSLPTPTAQITSCSYQSSIDLSEHSMFNSIFHHTVRLFHVRISLPSICQISSGLQRSSQCP
jgi:hypothetical protein